MSIEAFVRNARRDNYAQSLVRIRQLAAQCDFRAAAKKLRVPEQDGFLAFRLLGGEYRLRLSTCEAEMKDSRGEFTPAGFADTMILYDILAFAPEGETASGEYVSLPSLSAVKNAADYAGAGMFSEAEQYWQTHTAQIGAALRQLGAVPFGKGDLGFLVPLFFDQKMAVSFWNADEDFPPQLTLLFDRSILHYMHYETVWYLAMRFLDICKDLAEMPQHPA